jgi:hypothetical protein
MPTRCVLLLMALLGGITLFLQAPTEADVKEVQKQLLVIYDQSTRATWRKTPASFGIGTSGISPLTLWRSAP